MIEPAPSALSHASPARVAGFDYSKIDTAVADEARGAAHRYRLRTEAYVMDTGRDLLAIKARLDHGVFLQWVEVEMGLAPRTAQNFMQAAAQLGHKSEIVSHLPPTTLYRLAAPSTPEHVREEVLELATRERVDAKVVDEMVAQARFEAKEEARKLALSPEARKVAEQRERTRKAARRKAAEDSQRRAEEERERTERRTAATEELARLLVDHLGTDAEQALSLLEAGNPFLLAGALRKAISALEPESGRTRPKGGAGGAR